MKNKNRVKDTIQNEVSIDFGDRKVNTQNFSKTVVLPKTALTGCGCSLDHDIKLNVKLVTKDGQKVIVLTPVCDGGDE